MTCIIALKDTDCIWIGSDRQGTCGDTSTDWGRSKIISVPLKITDHDDNVIRTDTMTIAIAGSHFLQTYIRNVYHIPSKPDEMDFIEYLYDYFFKELNETLISQNLIYIDDSVRDSESGMIIVYKDGLYEVYDDFTINEANTFAVEGCGWKQARPILTNLLRYHREDMSIEDILRETLTTTGEMNIYCNADIDILRIDT